MYESSLICLQVRARRSSSLLQSQVNSWNAGARRSAFSSLPLPLFLSCYGLLLCRQTLLDVTSRFAADRGELDRARWHFRSLDFYFGQTHCCDHFLQLLFASTFYFEISYFLPLYLELCFANGESWIFLVFCPFPFLCVSPSFILLYCYYFSAAHGLLLLLLFALHTLTFHGYRFVDCDFFPVICLFFAMLHRHGHTHLGFPLIFFFVHLGCIYFLPSNMLLVDTLFSLHFSPVLRLVLLRILPTSLIFGVRVGFFVVSRW